MIGLHFQLNLLLILFFGIIYVIVTLFSSFLGITSFSFYIILAVFIMLIQYLLGPKIVEWSMRVKYVGKQEARLLYESVENLAKKARIPMPKVGISETQIPNAFAFGRSIKDGRVCVTRGILNLLNKDELSAVLGHELSHLKNRDVLFITFLSVIPLILYRIAFHLLFFGSFSRRRESQGYTALIGIAALLFYFITNLLVLYASRIREYFADKGSIELGNSPSHLATALYKLVYGSARLPRQNLRELEGLKAFFLNDVSRARTEIRELSQLDLDRSGTIDPYELKELKKKKVILKAPDRLMELLSTHPNMLKRIQHLSLYQKG
ncbi:MAG: M48 family metalloprotease [Candidatus Omnitrophica bacterium]|nr:M48 family metalloprotease [Candidatus Omnitrophota bacterium]